MSDAPGSRIPSQMPRFRCWSSGRGRSRSSQRTDPFGWSTQSAVLPLVSETMSDSAATLAVLRPSGSVSWGRSCARVAQDPTCGPEMKLSQSVSTDPPPSRCSFRTPSLHFPRQETILGGQESVTAEAVGELVLEGQCLRLKADHDDRTYFIVWPPGFTPHDHRGVVHVRNGAGRVIAQVGDRLRMGGGYSRWGDEKCPGPKFGANSIKVLSESESP